VFNFKFFKIMQLPQFFTPFKRVKRDAAWCCIAVCESGVFFVQVKHTETQIQVIKCEFFPITPCTSSALAKIFKAQRLELIHFTTLLAPEEYQILMVDAPNVPKDELKLAIRYFIKDSLDYPVEEAVVDVLLIPDATSLEIRSRSVYAIAASSETIQKSINLFENAGIDLSVIDIPEMALRNIAALYELGERGLIMLTFNQRGGLLVFTCNGEMYLSRRIEITFGQLQDANEQHRRQYFDHVELEVQRSLDYFDRQFHQISLSCILMLAPDGIDLSKQLEDSLGYQVDVLDLTQVMDISAAPELLDREFLSEALLPLGAALRQNRHIL